jgi:hypothetical protein
MPERDPSALYELAAVEALGDTESVFAAPRHAFTAELIRSTLTR